MADSYYENAHHDADSDSTPSYANGNGAAPTLLPSALEQSPQQHTDGVNGQYANGAPTPSKNEGGAAKSVKRALNSWVGFSNLPNQVHRRSVR